MNTPSSPTPEPNWVPVDYTSVELAWAGENHSLTLRVKGTTPHISERGAAVKLQPAAYATRPEFGRIDVLWDTKDAIFPTETPFDISLAIDSALGTKGIEIVGKTRSQRVEFVESKTAFPQLDRTLVLKAATEAYQRMDQEVKRRFIASVAQQGMQAFEQLRQKPAPDSAAQEEALLHHITAISHEIQERIDSFRPAGATEPYKQALAAQAAYLRQKSDELLSLEPEARRLAEQQKKRPAQLLYHMLPDLKSTINVYVEMYKGCLATEARNTGIWIERNKQLYEEWDAWDKLNSARIDAVFNGLRLIVV